MFSLGRLIYIACSPLRVRRSFNQQPRFNFLGSSDQIHAEICLAPGKRRSDQVIIKDVSLAESNGIVWLCIGQRSDQTASGGGHEFAGDGQAVQRGRAVPL